jgi:hypothetical protein
MAEYDNTNRGVLFINDRKQSDKHPDHKGSINVGGKEYWLSAWNKTGAKGDFISLSIELKEAQGTSSPKPSATPKPAVNSSRGSPPANFDAMSDDIPF